jgi:hypothetical protein
MTLTQRSGLQQALRERRLQCNNDFLNNSPEVAMGGPAVRGGGIKGCDAGPTNWAPARGMCYLYRNDGFRDFHPQACRASDSSGGAWCPMHSMNRPARFSSLRP